jgi:hypothetical protein
MVELVPDLGLVVLAVGAGPRPQPQSIFAKVCW